MTELVTEVKTLMVHLKCESCNVGTMQVNYDGHVLASYPPIYTHRCSNCGHTELLHRSYPYTRIIPIEELREPTEYEKEHI